MPPYPRPPGAAEGGSAGRGRGRGVCVAVGARGWLAV